MLAEIGGRRSSWEHLSDLLDSQLERVRPDAEPTVLDRIRADPANVMRLAGYEPDPWQEDVLRCGHPWPIGPWDLLASRSQ